MFVVVRRTPGVTKRLVGYYTALLGVYFQISLPLMLNLRRFQIYVRVHAYAQNLLIHNCNLSSTSIRILPAQPSIFPT